MIFSCPLINEFVFVLNWRQDSPLNLEFKVCFGCFKMFLAQTLNLCHLSAGLASLKLCNLACYFETLQALNPESFHILNDTTMQLLKNTALKASMAFYKQTLWQELMKHFGAIAAPLLPILQVAGSNPGSLQFHFSGCSQSPRFHHPRHPFSSFQLKSNIT